MNNISYDGSNDSKRPQQRVLEAFFALNKNNFRIQIDDGPIIEGFRDGRFKIICSGGTLENKVILGHCLEDSIAPRPIKSSPSALYFDCNVNGHENAFRVYRIENQLPVEPWQFSFDSDSGYWQYLELAGRNQSNGEMLAYISEDSSSGHRSNENTSTNFPDTLFTTFIRFLLWPVADFHWKEKIEKRKIFSCLYFLEKFEMNRDGNLTLSGHVLDSIQLRGNGTARIQEKLMGPGDVCALIPRIDRKSGEQVPWIEWYGNLLHIQTEQEKKTLAFFSDHWQQWGVTDPSIWQALKIGETALVDLGRRLLTRCFIISGIIFLVFMALLLMLQISLNMTA